MKTQSKNKKSSARRTAKGVGSGRLVRPFWRVEGVPATTIESFATRHGLQMVVRERRKPISAPDRYYASFENVEVMNPPGFLLSTFGNGATPEQAVAAYAEEISMKRIAIGAYTSERREIEVPRLCRTIRSATRGPETMDTQKDLSSLPATSSKPGGSVPPSCAVSSGSGARRTTATWTLELNCECPHCKEWVDLLDYADFWDAHSGSLEACEHGTKRSNGIEVTCPECTKDFEVDCEY